ncbi:hypothetical protein TWF281_006876 [Arthrobotrys megalospora]
MHILALPVEIQTQILGELPWHDHFLVAEVCPLWASILQHHGLRRRRHYDHPAPADWDIMEHQYPVFDASTPRVTQANVYTPMNGPNTHVLLEQAMLMFEVQADGRTVVFMRLPRHLVSGSLSEREVLRPADTGNAESVEYSEFWQGLCPDSTETAVIDIGDSPLLSSDKLIFSIAAIDGEDISDIQLPGLPDGPRRLLFTFWNWERPTGRFSPFGDSGEQSPPWASSTYDWALGSPQELIEAVKSHLETYVWNISNNGSENPTQTCFCQVTGFNLYGPTPGEAINVTVGLFPRTSAAS